VKKEPEFDTQNIVIKLENKNNSICFAEFNQVKYRLYIAIEPV
jgi:hypothetical protein